MIDDISKLNNIHCLLVEAVCLPEMPSLGCAGVNRPLINAILLLKN
jgi:hypothetical protein